MGLLGALLSWACGLRVKLSRTRLPPGKSQHARKDAAMGLNLGKTTGGLLRLGVALDFRVYTGVPLFMGTTTKFPSTLGDLLCSRGVGCAAEVVRSTMQW